MRQNDRKNDGVPKNVYWPIGLKMFHKWFWATFERKLKFEHFCPGEVIVRQKDNKKLWRTKRFLLAHWFGNVSQMILSYIWAKTKIWKFCFVFAIRFQGFPTFCTFFMYINVHGHQIFAKCTLNECTKMELDPPLPLSFIPQSSKIQSWVNMSPGPRLYHALKQS